MVEDGNYATFFRLGEDERIVKYIKPLPALKAMWFFQGLVGIGFIFVFLAVFLLPFAIGSFGNAVFILILLVILWLLASYASAQLQYNKADYWITNKRVTVKRGFIGYHISSIPFERISDVVITRSLWEKLFGVGGLYIQSLAGQITYQHRMGAEGAMPATPNPEEMQELIFKLVKEKRKEEKLTM